MARVRTADVLATVNRTVQEQAAAAAGNNTLISHSEQTTLPADLDAVAQAMRADGGPGTLVGVDALVQRATSAIKDAVDSANVRGAQWLSKVEIKALVEAQPAIGARVRTAIDLLAVAPPPAPVDALPPGPLSGAQIRDFLAPRLADLRFDGLLGSEGGEPISVVRVPGPFTQLNRDIFSATFNLDPAIDAQRLDLFERPTRALLNDFVSLHRLDVFPAGTGDKAQAVVELMRRDLSELRVVVQGRDGSGGANHPTYLVGLAGDGDLVGIKTAVIWT